MTRLSYYYHKINYKTAWLAMEYIMPAMLSCMQPLPWVCNHLLGLWTREKCEGLFCFDFVLFIFFFKLYSGAQCVSSKALLSSVQLMNITMALRKKPSKDQDKAYVTCYSICNTVYYMTVKCCHWITWIVLYYLRK